ncbi:MAG: methyltransferase domain-containing protein [Acetobacteraceae bacterium]
MTTDYNVIGEQYRVGRQQAWRRHIEFYTMMRLIGNPAGKHVIDIACGEGTYSRALMEAGAASVIGVDLSETMVQLAAAMEAERPLGIRYQVGDGRNLGFGPQFDLAVAGFLLNYARDRAELEQMCRSIAQCLRPGGRFLTVNASPLCNFPSAPSFRKYGFEAATPPELYEGAPITFTIYLDGSQFNVENFHLSPATHEAALHAAGFHDIRWHKAILSPEAERAFPPGYWDDFLSMPPIAFIDCYR